MPEFKSKLTFFEPKDIPVNTTHQQYANVLLPVGIPKYFTYKIPTQWHGLVQRGMRVVVQFGPKRITTAVVMNVHAEAPLIYEAKSILELLEETPSLVDPQLRFFAWIAQYYLCFEGDVLQVGLPAGLKISSESKVQLIPEVGESLNQDIFSETEQRILDLLAMNDALGYDDIAASLKLSAVYAPIRQLMQKGKVLVFDEVKNKYQPKIIKNIYLEIAYQSKEALQALVQSLEKRPAQLDLLLKYLQYQGSGLMLPKVLKPIERSELLSPDLSVSGLQTLIKKQIFTQKDEIVPRFPLPEHPERASIEQLSPLQKKAKEEIHEAFQSHDIVLLHGITGSGKTEIYMTLIQEALDSGTQVLLMLPEIALTTQMVMRIQKFFGHVLGVYHSRYSDNERVEVWHGVQEGKFNLVVGARSSVFLPFQHLGLIIVDEEHDQAYKQQDPAPRYHGRDAAMALAKIHHAKVLLGSATPSLESYHLAREKKYGLVSLLERFHEGILPQIFYIDMRHEVKEKKEKRDFSKVLLEKLQGQKTAKKQSILFQNLRGYAPQMQCEDCGWIPQCKSCDVSLTFHLFKNECRCHYCGYKEKPSIKCPACGSSRLRTMGSGTEKIEEELRVLEPEWHIARMDLDTTRAKGQFQKIFQELASGHTDVLIGTQMVTKGLDFDGVTLVGVMDADRMLHFPDFRSYERAFQMLVQVAGRAGRRQEQGHVYIQSYQPNHWVLQQVALQDYAGFYEREILERGQFHYPPFTRLIKIVLKCQEKPLVDKASVLLAEGLRTSLGSRVLGPESPLIDRIRDQFLKQILIKIERQGMNLTQCKKFIFEQLEKIGSDKAYKKVHIVVDVDPY